MRFGEVLRICLSSLLLAATASGLFACSGCTDEDPRTSGSTDSAADTTGANLSETSSDTDADTAKGLDADPRRDISVNDVTGNADASSEAGTETDIGDHDSSVEDGRDVSDSTSADLAGDSSSDSKSSPDSTGTDKPACQNGPGQTLFRFHYEKGRSARHFMDVWEANCSYGQSQMCRIDYVRDPSFTSRNFAVIVTRDSYIRVRFNVNGLSFSKAAVYLQARSYSTTSSTDFAIWSPLYGEKTGGPVDNDFTYNWYKLDWTGYLKPGDDPGLTAIEIYGEGELALHALEMCIQ